MEQSIFKSYDIRGVYPSELNEAAAFEVGRAFVRHTKSKSVVIGQDARISSPALFMAFAAGVQTEGGQIHDIGQVPTEYVYFVLGSYNFDSGIMITASHNPKEYNGFKMMKRAGSDIQIVRGQDFLFMIGNSPITKIIENKNQIIKEDFWKDYLKHILSLVDLSEIVPLKVVVDASNGVAGHVVLKIQDKLPAEIIPLNFEPDGNFPNHAPNPLLEGSADQIKELIKKEKADFGLMFDADADRIFLVDENGRLVPADLVLLLLAKYFLQKNPGMAVAYNLICSKSLPIFIKKYGGVPIKTQVGFVNVRDGLLKNNGIMGGELSGHYCFKDNFYMDSGMIALLTLLVIFSKDRRKVSEIVQELSIYAKTDYNFELENKAEVIDKVKEKYSDGKQDYLDGVTVEYKDWWFNIRPSNTEPLLRLTIEADSQEILDEKLKEAKDFVNKIAKK